MSAPKSEDNVSPIHTQTGSRKGVSSSWEARVLLTADESGNAGDGESSTQQKGPGPCWASRIGPRQDPRACSPWVLAPEGSTHNLTRSDLVSSSSRAAVTSATTDWITPCSRNVSQPWRLEGPRSRCWQTSQSVRTLPGPDTLPALSLFHMMEGEGLSQVS